MAQIPLKIFNSKTGKFEFDVTVLSLPADASISSFKGIYFSFLFLFSPLKFLFSKMLS